jgi:vitamin B12 transporter
VVLSFEESKSVTCFRYALAALSLLPTIASGQSAGAAGDEDIIVTATGARQNADDTGQAVTLIGLEQIEQRQSQSVADLVATTLGVTISRNGGPGQTTAVRIRGAEDSQTLALIDGVRVNDPSSPTGAFDFGNLLTGNIARVEVLRGPNSVPWGSQALGGVVNVITAAPSEDLSASMRAEYGYKDNVQLVGQVGKAFGPIAASFGGGYFRDEGISSYGRGTERDGYRQYAANGRVEVKLAPDVSIDLRGYFADSRASFDGFAPPLFNFADTLDFAKTQQVFGYAGLNAATFGGKLRNRLAFTISDTRRDSFDGIDPAPSFIARGRIERFEYQGDATLADQVRAVVGVEHETSRFDDGFSRTSTGVTSGFAQLILKPLEGLTTTGGVRVDDYRTYGTKVTTSTNAAWRIGRNTLVRVSYGEGFKAPTLFQLFSFYGNTALNPETARSVDIGIEQTLVDGMKLGVTVFRRDTRNQINFDVSATRPDGFYNNVDRTRAEGAEAFVELRPTRTLVFLANYTLTDAKNRATGEVLLRRPRKSIAATVDWTPRRGFDVGATLQTVSGSRDVDSQTFDPIVLDGYTLASLRASFPLGERFEIYGRIENLFDARYETVSGYGSLGRNAHVGVRVRI